MKNVDMAAPAKGFTKTAIAALMAGTMLAGGAFAQAVTLKANDGSVNLEGDLISFEDGIYTIRTPIGDMRMSAARVRCEGDPCPQIGGGESAADVDFVVAGSDTVGDELMPLLVEGFASNLEAEADIHSSNDAAIKAITLIGDQGYGDEFASLLIEARGSSFAFTELLEGRAEIGMSSRRIRRSEARALRDAGAGSMISVDQERVIAVDSLLVLLSPTNPVEVLSLEQLSGIYAGEINNWSEVGGPDLAITVYSRAESSGTRATFDISTLDAHDKTLRSDAIEVSDNIVMSRSVLEDPGGVGYAAFAFQRGAKSVDIISDCGIRTQPNAFGSKTEEYPLQRRLYLYNKAGDMAEQASALLDYAVSEAADGLVSKAGFINLGVTQQPQDVAIAQLQALIDATNDQFEADQMRSLMQEMQSWDRLSTTFRFAPGSSNLDNKAKRDLERIVNFLENAAPGTQVELVGFTDANGPDSANLQVSAERSAHVVEEFAEFAGDRLSHIEFSSKGFGEMSPAACNETVNGRSINRRVEVWIR